MKTQNREITPKTAWVSASTSAWTVPMHLPKGGVVDTFQFADEGKVRLPQTSEQALAAWNDAQGKGPLGAPRPCPVGAVLPPVEHSVGFIADGEAMQMHRMHNGFLFFSRGASVAQTAPRVEPFRG